MIKKIRNISLYTFSNFISVLAPIAIVPLLVSLLSKESYSEMVSGQLAFFYSTIIIGFGLNTTGITLIKSDNSKIIGMINIIKFKSILFFITLISSLFFFIFFDKFQIVILIYILSSFFEIFNITPLILHLEKPIHLLQQKLIFTILYFLLIYTITPYFPTALFVAISFFVSLMFSYIFTYVSLIKKYRFSADYNFKNKDLVNHSYKYFLSQIGGQIYSTIPRLLSLNFADLNYVKIVDVIEKIVMMVRILISSITSWYGSIFLKKESYKSIFNGLLIVLLICLLLIFPGHSILKLYISLMVGLEEYKLLNVLIIISSLLFVTTANIFLAGYVFLKRKKEIYALFFLIISCLIVFTNIDALERMESVYLLMLKTEIFVFLLSIVFFTYLKFKK